MSMCVNVGRVGMCDNSGHQIDSVGMAHDSSGKEPFALVCVFAYCWHIYYTAPLGSLFGQRIPNLISPCDVTCLPGAALLPGLSFFFFFLFYSYLISKQAGTDQAH